MKRPDTIRTSLAVTLITLAAPAFAQMTAGGGASGGAASGGISAGVSAVGTPGNVNNGTPVGTGTSTSQTGNTNGNSGTPVGTGTTSPTGLGTSTSGTSTVGTSFTNRAITSTPAIGTPPMNSPSVVGTTGTAGSVNTTKTKSLNTPAR